MEFYHLQIKKTILKIGKESQYHTAMDLVFKELKNNRYCIRTSYFISEDITLPLKYFRIYN